MINPKNPQKKEILASNLKDDYFLTQQARDLQGKMKQIPEKEKKKGNENKAVKKNVQKASSPSDKHSPLEKQQQSKGQESEQVIVKGWSEKQLEVDHLSLSKDIIRFNGPLIKYVEGQGGEEEMKRATIKIQKIWKAKYHTIKKMKQVEQSDLENTDYNHADQNSAKQLKDDLLIKEFTFKPESSPQKKTKGNNPSNNIIQLSSEKGYLQKYNDKKSYDSANHQQEDQEEIKQLHQLKEPLQIQQKIEKTHQKDQQYNHNHKEQQNNNHKEQQNNNYKEQQNNNHKDENKIQNQQIVKEKKINQGNHQLKPNSANGQRKNNLQGIKLDSPQNQSKVVVNKVSVILEKKHQGQDKVTQSQQNQQIPDQPSQPNIYQSNQIIQLYKKMSHEQASQLKSKEYHQNTSSPAQQNNKDITKVVDSQKQLISQIISNQIQQMNNEKKQQNKSPNQVKPASAQAQQKPQKEEQKNMSNSSVKWDIKDKEVLIKLVEVYGQNKWSVISQHLPNKTPEECQTMYEKLISL